MPVAPGGPHMMDMDPMNPIVGEAITSLEFTTTGLGSGADNESDPVTFLKEQQALAMANANTPANSTANTAHMNMGSSTTTTTNNSVGMLATNGPASSTNGPASADTNNNSHHNSSALFSNSINNGNSSNSSDVSLLMKPSTSNIKHEDTSAADASSQEATRQNALLKQLLQNCPAADLKGQSENDTASTAQPSSTTTAATSAAPVAVATPTPVATLAPNVNAAAMTHTTMTAGTMTTPTALVPSMNNLKTEVGENSNTSSPTMCVPSTSTGASNEASNSSEPSTPQVEKKLSYMDIRRAQLERDPTPPPDEQKTKRKRNWKRKESNKSVDDMETLNLLPHGSAAVGAATSTSFAAATSSSLAAAAMTAAATNQNPGGTVSGGGGGSKSSKKRVRKGSSNVKVEDTSSNASNSGSAIGGPAPAATEQQILAGILSTLQRMTPVSVIEPMNGPNMNLQLPPDAPDMNTTHSKLKGSFGWDPQFFDYFGACPLQLERIVAPSTATVTPGGPPGPSGGKPGQQQNSARGFYYEEFSRHIPDFEETLKEERHSEDYQFSFSVRNADSPDTVVSSSSPECVIYDPPKEDYHGMRYINPSDDEDNPALEEHDDANNLLHPVACSPVLKFLLPTKSVLLAAEKNNFLRIGQDNSLVRGNSTCGNLVNVDNIGITLTLDGSGEEVCNILETLSKLLNIHYPLQFKIEEASRITEFLSCYDQDHCRHCNRFLKAEEGWRHKKVAFKNGGNEQETALFCNQMCFQQWEAVLKGKAEDEVDNEIVSLLSEAEDKVDKELAKVATNGHHRQQQQREDEPMSIEEIKALINVSEKRFRNVRYLHYNPSTTFKTDHRAGGTSNQSLGDMAEDTEESIEDMYDQLNICLKPNASAVDRRLCTFCHQLGDGDINGPSRLLNMDVDKWVHLNCALWSDEVYEILNGALMNVEKAYQRGLTLACVKCQKLGASIKCFKLRCNNNYHFPCAIKDKCLLLKDKTLYCPTHIPKVAQTEELASFSVNRRVFINRDEHKQISAMFHQGDGNVLRIGSLIFLNIGQLFPHQLANFHSATHIYPVGYRVSRFYWSPRRLGKRCQYICSISESNGRPLFNVEVREEGYETVTYTGATAKEAWEDIVKAVAKLRHDAQNIKVFPDFISGEDLFGLNEPIIGRILESFPGVDTLADYTIKYGSVPAYELFLMVNPSGAARTEPRLRGHPKRPHHRLHVSHSPNRLQLQSAGGSASSSSMTLSSPEIAASPYVKTFASSKVTQFRKMNEQWRNNVYLARSRIQGLGLYAMRDMEKHTMIIEYIGILIRNEIAERFERIHEAHVSRLVCELLYGLLIDFLCDSNRTAVSTCSVWTTTR